MTQEGLKIILQPGQPCNHPGCLSHISHPCEGCGRIGGQGEVYENPFKVMKDDYRRGDWDDESPRIRFKKSS